MADDEIWVIDTCSVIQVRRIFSPGQQRLVYEALTGLVLEELKEVLAHPQVRNVFDPNKSTGADEADPHVLALAYYLKKQGTIATVLTEETRNRPDKLSMTSACGLLRIYCLPIEPFLREQGIWPG